MPSVHELLAAVMSDPNAIAYVEAALPDCKSYQDIVDDLGDFITDSSSVTPQDLIKFSKQLMSAVKGKEEDGVKEPHDEESSKGGLPSGTAAGPRTSTASSASASASSSPSSSPCSSDGEVGSGGAGAASVTRASPLVMADTYETSSTGTVLLSERLKQGPPPIEATQGNRKKLRAEQKKKKEQDRLQAKHAAAVSNQEDIVAMAQVSRFHRETITSEANDDLLLVDITLCAGAVELIKSATLHLFPDRRYGLIGRNGVGKSTLMKNLAAKTITGFPPSMTTILVDETPSDDVPVIELVLAADTERERLLREEAHLRRAIEEDDESLVLEVLEWRALTDLQDARDIANKRSRQRGYEARLVALDQEAAYVVAQEATVKAREEVVARRASRAASLASTTTSVTHQSPENEAGAAKAEGSLPLEHEGIAAALATPLLADVLAQLEAIQADARDKEARKILSNMGFTNEQMGASCKVLSGGWRMRVALARVLLLKPHLLLLDEPTKHLDMPAVVWLSGFLSNYEGMMLIVSHDRAFLNAVTTDTIILRRRTLTTYPGNYSAYQEIIGTKRIATARQAEKLEKQRKGLEAQIEKSRQRAAKTNDDSRMRQAMSRTKKLERLGLDSTESGKKWKVSYFGDRVQADVDPGDPPVSFKFPVAELSMMKNPLLVADAVSVCYGDRTILDKVSLTVEKNSRIALVGANGGGKSTLLSVLAGVTPCSDGYVQRSPKVRLAYFSQHDVDCLPMELTPVEYMCRHEPDPTSTTERAARAALGTFGLSGDVVTHRMSTLSGGQRSRVVFASITHPNPPHVLILDEPTNFLDLDTLEALNDALNEFPGAVVIVSHDQALLTSLVADVYHMTPGSMRFLEGGMEEYLENIEEDSFR